MSDNKPQFIQWLKRGTSTYLPTDNSITVPQVESGVYSIKYEQNIGYYLLKKDLNLDELLHLPSAEGEEVMTGIKTFWNRKEKFKEYGYAYKRGILLYGVPGGGKTSIINLLCEELTSKMNGVVFSISSDSDLGNYTSFMPEIYRVIEKDRPIIAIIEDIDGLCQTKETETKLLNVLDGIEQLENVVYIATTNYTERLSERIYNRPNRFDIRIEVTSPSEECRRIYFEHKLKAADLEKVPIEEWVKRTEGMTIAYLGEVIKSVAILGNSFDSTIQRLRNMRIIPTSRNYDNKNLNFGFRTSPKEEEYVSR